jgi:hypothetical protein
MSTFLYASGGFLAAASLVLFLTDSPSSGLFLLLVSVVFFGLGAWVHYEQGRPMRERLAEERRRHENEMYLRRQRQEVEERRGATEVDSDKWWRDHHRGLWDPNYLPKPAPSQPKIEISHENQTTPETIVDPQREWLSSRIKPARQRYGVSHRGAEELTAEWLTYLGEQDVSITQYSNDGGVDVLTKTYCCQVKNYDKKPVGVVEVRALLGTAVSKKLMPLLFTASKLTNEALAFSEQNRIAVVEFNAMDSTLSGLTLEGEKLLDSGRYK